MRSWTNSEGKRIAAAGFDSLQRNAEQDLCGAPRWYPGSKQTGEQEHGEHRCDGPEITRFDFKKHAARVRVFTTAPAIPAEAPAPETRKGEDQVYRRCQ